MNHNAQSSYGSGGTFAKVNGS